jgi:DNA-binding transcriptional ArsR family regulator
MATGTDRLERLLDAEECCEDPDARLDALGDLRDAATDGIDRDVQACAALADATRYRLVAVLDRAGECCVCELTPLVDVSESAVSHALSTLADAGLVERRKEGRWHYYRATERASALLAALDGNDTAEGR